MTPKLRRFSVVMAVALAASWSCSDKGGSKTRKTSQDRRITLFVTGELKGTIEPCGCTTDPLGDLARTAKLIDSARDGGAHVMYVDAGSMLYTHNPIPPELAAQERLKADLLVDVFGKQLEPAGVGLGPYDLARGPDAVKPARMASNVSADARVPLTQPEVHEIGGVEVGLFGVVSPAAVEPFGVKADPPAPAAKAAVAALEKKGAELVVALAHMTKSEARQLAQEVPGIDILVVGQNLPADPKLVSRGPTRVGDTFLIEPADRGQVVSRLDITMRGKGELTDAVGPARAKSEIESLEQRAAELEERLAQWRKDKDADQAFVAQKERELLELKERQQALKKQPLKIPETGPYFVMEQVKIKKGLPCLPVVVEAKAAFDKAAGAANLAAAKDDKPPEPDKGEPGFVGSEECSFCHAEELAFWKKTRHAHAWETLTEVGKEFNRDCIYCHVTGFGEPGGSNLGFNEDFRDVQCETCHGPGSLHVEADGNDQPRTIVRTPEVGVCIECHNEEHSDTFQFEPYLRDVTGEGHGETFRKKLGDGPTGRELRAAGLREAGRDIGAGCPK